MPKHIVIDARHWRDFGIGTYVRNLVRSLTALPDASRFRYTLIVSPRDAADARALAPAVDIAPYEHADQGVRHSLMFPRFIRGLKPDLSHIPLNSVAYWMPRPYVVTIHDMSTLLYPSHGTLREVLHKERYRRGAMRAARVIAVSDATRRDLETVLHVPAGRVTTIHGAPDPVFAESDDPENNARVLDRYSIRVPYVLYAGTIRPQKNVARLVEAFAVVRGELDKDPAFKDLRLVILGDDLSRHPAVRRAVVATRVEPFVRFLGFVPRETLRIFYRAAALFAFPSLYEGFGLAPLEAMACGTPVLASNIPSVAEAVGDAAELVSPDNVFDIARGLRALLSDKARREELAALGRARAAGFRWETTAAQTTSIYSEIFSDSSH